MEVQTHASPAAGLACLQWSMSKKQQERKAARRELEQARKVTAGKLIRLLLKSVGFAIAVSLLVVFVNAVGIPGFDKAWMQMVLVVIAYLVAYPYLMREFRPRKVRAPAGRDSPERQDAKDDQGTRGAE